MELKKVLAGLENLKAKGNLDIDIKGIESDSRKVEKDFMFVAIKGFSSDGHNFIDKAIENGANCIMIEEGADVKGMKIPADVTVVMAPNTRYALAISACNFYQNPSRKFKLIGITGTKGKTTTTFMMKRILEQQGQKVGLIGTIAKYIGDKCLGESDRTTPDSLELQRLFAQMVEEKVDTVVMEVSSQSLKLDRVAGCDFDIAVFTNFTEDHISEKEHPNMQDYFESKLKLFQMCKTGFINADDIQVVKVKKLFPKSNIKTYGIDNPADLLAKDVTVTNSYVDFRVKLGEKNERVKTSIPGRFSVYNSLAAISVAKELGVTPENIKLALEDVRVPGRSELVPNKKGLTIMIDYAHSPESLNSILKAVKSYTQGRVISVFGCGGDRDSGKRPIMGEISGTVADYTIITSDNPRTEDPETIVRQIEEGMKKTNGKYEVIVDRREAIKSAIEMASKRDIIVLAGKGHETYQEINGEKLPFDERVIIKDIFKNMK
ncbi:MAG: UDP-N-acetylmuramoyl-L-alanyl-D-glutamate--2,6-diaminopimelate ligase [Clostridia bacterium]|nr:UDP-N-acetylmuramoyl-L-alanyl-D-glutamate--2,6-diaminopimelate ligase [Clostridia bacterium]